MRKQQNTFVALLDSLKVKHTKVFSNRLFREHPHKYNLLGLSEMLSIYNIKNAGIRIENKEKDLSNIKCPFIAHTGGDFVMVYKVKPGNVHCLLNGKKTAIPVSQFINSWSGIILLAETTSDSIEPNYKEHRKKDWADIAQKSILVLAGALILGMTYIDCFLFNDIGITFLLIINLVGVYICCLLVLQQLHIHSWYVDKICSLFSKNNCNNVLESDAAKLWGIFGWSEVGLGYFTANIIILLFLPHLISYLAVINILVLPYSFWSVWYQKVKVRQWCPLCLIVQVLLWVVFLSNGLFGYIQIPGFYLQDVLMTGCIYAIPIFTLNLLIPLLSRGGRLNTSGKK